MNDRELHKPSQDIEDQALDFLEQWLSGSPTDTTEYERPTEAPRSLDPSLRAIERLVSQHKELFRRHSLVAGPSPESAAASRLDPSFAHSEEAHRRNQTP